MSRTFVQPADVMTYIAPTGGVTAGLAYLIGGLFVVARTTALVGVAFDGDVEGVHTLPKVTGEGTLPEGQVVFWDVTNARITIDSTAGLPIGTILGTPLTGDTTANVRLHAVSMSGRVHTIRKRFSTAQVNAGATLLPAMPGCSYRMVDAFGIAVGGAMTSNTTADITATLSSSSRKLVAFAQAGMTQSTLVRAGSASGAILADGASFTKNDVNTPILVSNTGSAITVMTNIDYTLLYVIE